MIRLSAEDLGCVRGGRQVFAGIGLSVAGGSALMITGRNGSGKSSLLRILAGLLQASSGRFWFEGGDSERSIAEQAHYLGHQDALKPSLTLLENLDFWSRYLGRAGLAPDAALTATGLGELRDLPAGYLSAGQRRRLSIARLVSVNRPIWLLDEPHAALDSTAQTNLAAIMRTHLAGGGLIVAATHGPLGLDGAQELRLGETG